MPYFVYQISPPLRLTHLDTTERYQDARTLVRQLRESRADDDTSDFRLIFANHQSEAERLLSRPKDERVIGED